MSVTCPGCLQRDAQIEQLLQRLQELEGTVRTLQATITDLQARLGRNASNSSIPPSANPPQAPSPVRRTKTGKPPGGQPGHKPTTQQRLPKERIGHTIALVPSHCAHCQTALPQQPGPTDPEPTWHQVIELPRSVAVVTEYQGHYRRCPCCQKLTHHPIPHEIARDTYGPRLSATLSYLNGTQFVSRRGAVAIVEDLLDVPISLGSVQHLALQVGEALTEPCERIAQHVRVCPVKYVDETSWKQGGQKMWLWICVAMNATFFWVHQQRSRAALAEGLGEEPQGVLHTDRFGAYDHLEAKRRQYCWAHLQRDFQALVDRGGPGSPVGRQLLIWTELLFYQWYRVRDGEIPHPLLKAEIALIRRQFRTLLERGSMCGCARSERFCAGLLLDWESLWVFTEVAGVEPTNNAAERGLRPAVLWRKRSQGSESAAGSALVGKLLSVVQTLRSQKLGVLDFLTEALSAYRQGLSAPVIPNLVPA
jgi:transposase